MRLIKDHILRKVHENVVLMPLSDGETDFKGMITLNTTGEFICCMLRQDTDKARLVAGLTEEYEVSPEQAEADLDDFLAELDSCHMLIR